ncbi:hypothetical protein MUO14_08985 [Halobacillus shinanisalinarum]|uniref:Polyhydroxyalkanoate synthesis regulator phasin n=1 Tax=Halobacillus shinanisalinarum TaxID=2932258 RepID=A0ABY4H412_9BACI|nr:hypothetical protein [Halobacillus shinanisalinarum]UOQ95041.1 hypothetical protein MUO14_08985 [Halobacillus shinanisalinarum]
MRSLLKQGFYLGLGAAVSGKEKFEKKVNEMVAKGDVTPSEAKDILNAWVTKGEQTNEEWNEQSRARIKGQMKRLGFVTREEYEQLEARIHRLENRDS